MSDEISKLLTRIVEAGLIAAIVFILSGCTQTWRGLGQSIGHLGNATQAVLTGIGEDMEEQSINARKEGY